jgi:hypothetical protein
MITSAQRITLRLLKVQHSLRLLAHDASAALL